MAKEAEEDNDDDQQLIAIDNYNDEAAPVFDEEVDMNIDTFDTELNEEDAKNIDTEALIQDENDDDESSLDDFDDIDVSIFYYCILSKKKDKRIFLVRHNMERECYISIFFRCLLQYLSQEKIIMSRLLTSF